MYYRIKYDLIGDLDVKTVMQNEIIFFSKNEEPQSWMGYFGQALKTSATYLPTQVTEMFNQGRAFATARLPSSGLINVCALSV